MFICYQSNFPIYRELNLLWLNFDLIFNKNNSTIFNIHRWFFIEIQSRICNNNFPRIYFRTLNIKKKKKKKQILIDGKYGHRNNERLCWGHHRNDEPAPWKIGNIARLSFKRARRELITAALLTTDKNCFRFGDYTVKIYAIHVLLDTIFPSTPQWNPFRDKAGAQKLVLSSWPSHLYRCEKARKSEK